LYLSATPERAIAEEMFARDQHGKPLLPIENSTLYAFGRLIRETEELLLRLFSEGMLSGTTHTCIGQELCQMSVVRALDHPGDIVLSNHRNHGHFLTYTGDFGGLIGEIMGRECGVCNGIGGSQHLAYRGFHSNGVQGGMTAIGVGRALAIQKTGGEEIVVSIVGDGTLGQGLLYESMNLASVWKTPLLFVVEHNRIAQTTSTAETTAGDIEARARAFDIETWRFDDGALDFFESVESVVRHVRAKGRPGMLVIDTMRIGPHSKGDDLRDSAEMDAIRERDPLERLGALLSVSEREEIRRLAAAYVQAVRDRVKASPAAQTPLSRTSIFIASQQTKRELRRASDQKETVRHGLNKTLRELLAHEERVLLLGEDLHDPYGGAFKVTAGLSTGFPDRVISTPISEAGVVGAGIGLALAGFLPIVEIMFADFVTLAFDQIFNHAVKFPGMFREAQVPLVIRTPVGGRRGYGPTHSQSPENLLCAVPGLTVVFPSTRHDPSQILWDSVMNWPYPTIFLEHKLLYAATVDPSGYRMADASPDDTAAALFPTLVRGDGDPDVTLVAYGGAVELSEQSAAELEEEELSVEIVVPSLLSPLPRHTLIGLLARRKHIVTIEESQAEFGVGAELGALLLENGYRGKYARVGTPPVPIPAARSLEAQIIPGRQHVSQAVLKMLIGD
jgi:2-oxoisovalerate dehydrogenase E1 component